MKEKEKLLQNGPDLKELEFLCRKYGDVTESIAIKRAVHNSYLEASCGPFAEMMKSLENLKFGSNAPVTKVKAWIRRALLILVMKSLENPSGFSRLFLGVRQWFLYPFEVNVRDARCSPFLVHCSSPRHMLV